MTRKDVKGDQPSGGETTWTNTGATRYGRGQHKTGLFGDDMLRPSPNHGTQRLPNDDMQNEFTTAYRFQVRSAVFQRNAIMKQFIVDAHRLDTSTMHMTQKKYHKNKIVIIYTEYV